MKKSELKIPNAILTLAEKGIWPNEQLSSYQEGCNFIEDEVLVQKIAPDEKYIFFHTLSGFRTMADEIMFDEELWHEIGALNQIDVNKCLVIGDFGLGSDTPIILDYSENYEHPTVKRLVWKSDVTKNYWEVIAKDMEEFVKILELC